MAGCRSRQEGEGRDVWVGGEVVSISLTYARLFAPRALSPTWAPPRSCPPPIRRTAVSTSTDRMQSNMFSGTGGLSREAGKETTTTWRPPHAVGAATAADAAVQGPRPARRYDPYAARGGLMYFVIMPGERHAKWTSSWI